MPQTINNRSYYSKGDTVPAPDSGLSDWQSLKTRLGCIFNNMSDPRQAWAQIGPRNKSPLVSELVQRGMYKKAIGDVLKMMKQIEEREGKIYDR